MNEQDMIAEALEVWKLINNVSKTWATFEAVRFTNFSMCAVKWGVIHSNGIKEFPNQTIIWRLYDSGKYDKAVRLTYP